MKRLLRDNSRESCIRWVKQFESWRVEHKYDLTYDKLVRDFATHLYEKGKAYSSIKTGMTWVRRYLRWLGESQEVASQKQFEIPKTYYKELYCPTKDVVDGILNARNSISMPYGYAIYLLSVTGMRDSELINLKYNDWNVVRGDNGIPHISFRLTITKNGKPRDVPMLKEADSIFKEYVNRIRPEILGNVESIWLFPQQKNPDKPILRKNVEFYMRNLRKALGNTEVTCHSLRRYYVTKLMAEKIPAETVAKIIGHSNMRNFARYFRPSAEHLADALGEL